MGDPKAPDGRTGTPHREVPQVLVLAGPGTTPAPAKLIAAWQDALPAAALRALDVLDGAETVTGAQVLRRISAARLSTWPVLLVGLRGGEAVALRAALDIPDRACRGALICGDLQHLPPLPIVQSGARSLPLRFVWETPNPLPSATALGEWLSLYRAHGMDAQGLVVPPSSAAPPCGAATSRAGLAFLSELVAIALSSR